MHGSIFSEVAQKLCWTSTGHTPCGLGRDLAGVGRDVHRAHPDRRRMTALCVALSTATGARSRRVYSMRSAAAGSTRMARRAWQVAGRQLHRKQDRGHGCENCRIGRSHPVKHAGETCVSDSAAHQPSAMPAAACPSPCRRRCPNRRNAHRSEWQTSLEQPPANRPVEPCARLRFPQEAVVHVVAVRVVSRNLTRSVVCIREGALAGCRSRARSVEPDNGATGSPYKAVTGSIRVGVDSINGAERIDVIAVGARSARDVEGNELAIGIPQKAMCHVVRVEVGARNLRQFIDAVRVVPWYVPVPAPGTSNVVIVPSGARR